MNSPSSSVLSTLIQIAGKLDWVKMVAELWRISRKAYERYTNVGLYEVLDYKASLELIDAKGESAKIQKYQKVRYLQNNIMAYQDQAWGDGQILQNYQCSPGVAVDKYEVDQKSLILISLRGTRQRGDVDDFYSSWEVFNGFEKETEYWSIDVNHPFQNLTLEIIFPSERPPIIASIIEGRRNREFKIDLDGKKKLPDGRWLVEWKKKNPRRFERYILQWEW